MKAWRVEAFGEPTEQWQLQENAPDCEPGPGELKVAVDACGLGLPGTSCYRLDNSGGGADAASPDISSVSWPVLIKQSRAALSMVSRRTKKRKF